MGTFQPKWIGAIAPALVRDLQGGDNCLIPSETCENGLDEVSLVLLRQTK